MRLRPPFLLGIVVIGTLLAFLPVVHNEAHFRGAAELRGQPWPPLGRPPRPAVPGVPGSGS